MDAKNCLHRDSTEIGVEFSKEMNLQIWTTKTVCTEQRFERDSVIIYERDGSAQRFERVSVIIYERDGFAISKKKKNYFLISLGTPDTRHSPPLLSKF